MTEQHFYRSDEALCDAPILYRGAGLDGIYLCNGYERFDEDGEWFTLIKDISGLHNAIGMHLVENRKVLSPKEVRFLRLAMDVTQSELGRMLGVTSQSVARWEKDQCEMPGPADRMLRIHFLKCLVSPEEFQEYVLAQTKRLDEMDQSSDEPMKFVHDDSQSTWKESAPDRELEDA